MTDKSKFEYWLHGFLFWFICVPVGVWLFIIVMNWASTDYVPDYCRHVPVTKVCVIK